MATSIEDNPNVWKLENIESTYWDEYIATRPSYDSAIFQPIVDYQSSHSNRFGSALDIGTGSGSALIPLTNHFDHVIGSDNDPTSLDFASKRFAGISKNRLSYTLSKGEDLKRHHPPGSIDLITCAETFPLMDLEQAMDSILTLLRPGGTLALWFYGPPFFTEENYANKCQPILDQLMDCKFRPVVSGGGPAKRESWKRAAEGKASWFDYIPFFAECWNDVRRHKWNTQARLSYWTPAACDFDIELLSCVQKHEEVTEKVDHDFWKVEWDISMIRRYVGAAFPTPRHIDQANHEMNELFEKLETAMGGANAARAMSWPVVLVLAQKQEKAL